MFRRLTRFAVVGIVSNLLLLAIFALLQYAGIGAVPAGIVIYVIGVAGTYAFNRAWAFGATRSHAAAGIGYVAVHGCGIATVAAMQALLHDHFGVPALAVQLLAMIVVAGTSFMLLDRVVFPREPKVPR